MLSTLANHAKRVLCQRKTAVNGTKEPSCAAAAGRDESPRVFARRRPHAGTARTLAPPLERPPLAPDAPRPRRRHARPPRRGAVRAAVFLVGRLARPARPGGVRDGRRGPAVPRARALAG